MNCCRVIYAFESEVVKFVFVQSEQGEKPKQSSVRESENNDENLLASQQDRFEFSLVPIICHSASTLNISIHPPGTIK